MQSEIFWNACQKSLRVDQSIVWIIYLFIIYLLCVIFPFVIYPNAEIRS